MPIKKKITTKKTSKPAAKKQTNIKKDDTKPSSDLAKQKTVSAKKDFIYAVGRRKSASARVRYYKKGSGEIIVNNQNFKIYFPYFTWQQIVTQPLEMSNKEKEGKIVVKVKGGGKMGQAESIRLGITRVLVQLDPDLRKTLKKAGFLTRDPRVKERKKYGLKRARRAPQWQKR